MARIKVSVERVGGCCNLPVMVGDSFYLDGSKLSVPEGKFVCMWALQSMMPVFPILGVQDQLAVSPLGALGAPLHLSRSEGPGLFRAERLADDSD